MSTLSVRSDDTKIHIFHHPNPIELNVLLEGDIRLCGDQQNNGTNVKALMTHWDMFNRSTTFMQLLKWVEKSFSDCELDTFHTQTNYKLNSLWGMIYGEGDYAIPHHHLPSFFSFVYFVKVSENSSPLMFSASSTYIKPENGKLILFPSHLKHYVPEQIGCDERITISGNILATE